MGDGGLMGVLGWVFCGWSLFERELFAWLFQGAVGLGFCLLGVLFVGWF